MSRDSIGGLPARVGQTVTLYGWITAVRSSGKIAFLQLRDGSGFVQGVVVRGEVPDEVFNLSRSLSQESSLKITGVVRQDPRAPGGVELGVADLELISRTEDYPITPKEHGVDFLFERRHLHLRHRSPWATLRVRDSLIRAIHNFFYERDFIRFDPPMFMPTVVEGTTDLFQVDLFGTDEVYLSQSGQLYAEAGAMAHGKVYTFSPVFRAEKSKTRKHLLEFWMMEPEVAYLDHEGNMQLQEELLTHLVAQILDECSAELEMLGQDPSKLEPAASEPYPRLTYDEALKLLGGLDLDLAWGEDFGAPHETALGNLFDRPVIIEAWPTRTKAFYMEPFEGDPTRVKANDVIAPEGYGEIVGGSQRIHDLELLKQRITEHNLPTEPFAWYLDLRRYGSVPHSGFGLGIERTLAWLTGEHHLRGTIPFPRTLTRLYP